MDRIGKVEKYLLEKRQSDGALFFAFIDPMDYDSKEDAIKASKAVYEAGADMIVVGGSTGVQGSLLDLSVQRIKEAVDVPVTLFPGNIATITRFADAIYFMSMLNSRSPYWITGAQTLSAPILKKLDVEALPVGYIVVGAGETVGWVGDANGIPLDKPKVAGAMALAAEYMGFRFILTDAGSAAKSPVPPKMIGTIRKFIRPETFHIAAGGIRKDEEIAAAIRAGADAVQMGTLIEQGDAKKKASKIARIVKTEGKKRV